MTALQQNWMTRYIPVVIVLKNENNENNWGKNMVRTIPVFGYWVLGDIRQSILELEHP